MSGDTAERVRVLLTEREQTNRLLRERKSNGKKTPKRTGAKIRLIKSSERGPDSDKR